MPTCMSACLNGVCIFSHKKEGRLGLLQIQHPITFEVVILHLALPHVAPHLQANGSKSPFSRALTSQGGAEERRAISDRCSSGYTRAFVPV